MKRFRNATFARSRQTGAGLLEVLIAVLILGVGLLGIAAMQATALRNSQGSLERSQAIIQTYAILDAMRANIDAARIGRYNLTAMTCDAPDAGTLAATDLHNWIQSLKNTVGKNACGQINCGGVSCEITVQWDESRTARGAEVTTQQVTTRTRL